MARINAKKRDKKERKGRRIKIRKGIEAQRVKPPIPTRKNNAIMGDEEQKENNRERVPNPAELDHLVTSYDLHGSYVGPTPTTAGSACMP